MSKSTETYSFTKGQKVHLDDIYFVSGLAGGDWWDPDKESPTYTGDDGGDDDLIITRDINIEIIVND